MKIYLTTTNHFAQGKKDKYKRIGKVDVTKEKVIINIDKYPSNFYKLVVKGKHNAINTWIIITND